MEIVALLDELLDAPPGEARVARAPAAARPLLQALLDGPAPRAALLNLRKVVVACREQTGAELAWPPGQRALRALASVLASGPDLARLIARAPQRRLALLYAPDAERPVGRDAMQQQLRRRVAGASSADALRQEIVAFRNDHFIRLAACEFGTVPLEQVGRELADLADACVEVALEASVAAQAQKHGPPLLEGDPSTPCGVAVIAMGKYGAQELNFCSDIDVVVVYASDAGQAGPTSLHEFFAAVCRDLVALLSEPSSEGYAFRVDLRLRPEGSRGPLCNSLSAAESYYEAWGGPYDRLAWLKARHAAGDASIGEALIGALRPFVFPRAHGPEVVEQIRALSRRIRGELAARHVVAGFDVKLGKGGIRDVEFFVQALQLLHGGRLPALQRRSSLEVLDQLLFAGLITDDERQQLADAYDLYRRIEHRLQLHDGRQTHLLPEAGELRQQIIAHLGYAVDVFERELSGRRSRVSAIYDTLDEGGAAHADEEQLLPLLGRDVARDDLVRVLAGLGFRHPEQAASQLLLLKEKPWGPFGWRPSVEAERIATPLLRELWRSPDPDAALHHFVALSLRFGAYRGLWRLFAENPLALRLLCSLFGTSDYLAQILTRQPELLDHLLLAGQLTGVADASKMGEELTRRFAALEDPQEAEGRFGVLERFHDEVLLRVGLLDIAGQLPLERVWQQLSALAVLCLRHVYDAIWRQMVARYGAPREEGGGEAAMAVLGLGKLGSAEMSYGSDLDVIFIYSAEGQTDGARSITNHEFFARVAQRLIRALTSAFVRGSLYTVDARLRPSGRQGTLVVSREAFESYHRAEAQIWERQVLIKARAVAGDVVLGEQVERWITSYVFDSGVGAHESLKEEMRRLRGRVEGELAGEDAVAYNLKLGKGGLMDIEFLVQYWQCSAGSEHPALRVRATLEALEAARAAGVISDVLAKKLDAAYRFLRRLEGRLRIVHGKGAERLPRSPEEVEVVARRLGYRQQGAKSAGELLLDDYRVTVREVRETFEDVLGEERQR